MPFDPPAAPIAVARVDDTTWRLLSPITYYGSSEAWSVPSGFLTDFASAPRVTAWLVPRTGAYTAAAVVHDWLCSVAVVEGWISPSDADGVFRRILGEQGVRPVLRWCMWSGVRWGALLNRTRRPGWWHDAPKVILVSLVAAPLLLPAGIGVGFGWLCYRIAEWLGSAIAEFRQDKEDRHG